MRILIADDHPLMRLGIKKNIESLGYQVLADVGNGIQAYNIILASEPDIAILDINMPGYDGLELAKRLQGQNLRTRIVLLTMHKELSLYRQAQKLGIAGYLLKEQGEQALKSCLEQVSLGRFFLDPELEKELQIGPENDSPNLETLSSSERKILELIAKSHTSKEIAAMLFLSVKTIEGYRSRIIEKLKLPKEKNSLLKWALQNM